MKMKFDTDKFWFITSVNDMLGGTTILQNKETKLFHLYNRKFWFFWLESISFGIRKDTV